MRRYYLYPIDIKCCYLKIITLNEDDDDYNGDEKMMKNKLVREKGSGKEKHPQPFS